MVMIEQLFMSTLTNSIEAALLIGLVMACHTLLRDKLSPVWRYALWMLVMGKLMLPWLPGKLESRFSWFGLPNGIQERLAAESSMNPQDQLVGSALADKELSPGIHTELSTSYPAGSEAALDGSLAILQLISLGWLAGAVLVLLYAMIGYMRFAAALRKEAGLIMPAALREHFQQCVRQARIKQKVELRVTNIVSTPTLYGLFRPVVLIPQPLIGKLTETDWDYVFQHECIHLKRLDVGANLIFFVFTSIHWFNPMIWYGQSRMRMEQEAACDAKLLTSGRVRQADTYAACIIKVLENVVPKRNHAAGVGFSSYKNQITRRIHMIRNHRPMNRRVAFVGALLLAAAAVIALPSVFAKESDQGEPAAIIVTSNELTADGKMQEAPQTESMDTDEILFQAPAAGTVTFTYGEQLHPVSQQRTMHDGIDIGNEEGTVIHASAAGVITAATYDKAYGSYIIIKHNDIWQSEYRHLSELSVQEGDTIQAGDPIGLMGSTGHATGSHLHLSILQHDAYIDPMSVLDL